MASIPYKLLPTKIRLHTLFLYRDSVTSTRLDVSSVFRDDLVITANLIVMVVLGVSAPYDRFLLVIQTRQIQAHQKSLCNTRKAARYRCCGLLHRSHSRFQLKFALTSLVTQKLFAHTAIHIVRLVRRVWRHLQPRC